MFQQGPTKKKKRKKTREGNDNEIDIDKKKAATNTDESINNQISNLTQALTAYNFTLRTIKLIEIIYAKDFELGGYTTMSSLITTPKNTSSSPDGNNDSSSEWPLDSQFYKALQEQRRR